MATVKLERADVFPLRQELLFGTTNGNPHSEARCRTREVYSMYQGPKKGCFGCSLALVIPMGCLTLLLVVAGIVAAIVFGVFGAMKSSDVYKQALARAQSSPTVIEAMGTPIEAGMFLSGNINVQNASGNADINIPISGPKGKAVIHAVATKEGGVWSFTTLNVTIQASGERIDLLDEIPPQMSWAGQGLLPHGASLPSGLAG